MATHQLRLTDLTHGGGCGCKLAPSVLNEILAKLPAAQGFKHLLVGTETDDDAAVYQLNQTQAVVATTDFFTPIVDDPFDFGRIAATNAVSDVYAMGATPIFGLAIVGFPIGKLPLDIAQEILAGGASVCSAAGIPVAGGHSIDAAEPIYGLVVIGVVDPSRVMRNSTAQAGDMLVLTKRLGVGIYSAALKRQELDAESYADMLNSVTQLNSVGADLAGNPGVHAMTDVTGFGLLGHTLEMCRGASLGASIRFEDISLLPRARQFAESGIGTGAAKRNWSSYGERVDLTEPALEWQRNILCDPQTSGGLLIACSSEAAPEVLNLVLSRGFEHARIVGQFTSGLPRVNVS